MDKEELLIEKYGLCPTDSNYAEIKRLLEEEIINHDDNEGCGEYLRVLCFMIFFIGHVEDCELIWKAKMLNMDTGCMLDVGLLCGAGFEQTIDFISQNPNLQKMKTYLERCQIAGDELDKNSIINNFKQYYGCTE